MKIQGLVLITVLLAGCSSPSEQAPSPLSDASKTTTSSPSSVPPTDATTTGETTAPMSEMTGTEASRSPASLASATGVVQSVDSKASTVTIAHGPVAALQWPAMTMTFQTGSLNLDSIKPGDHVAFEFTASGAQATLSKIATQ